MHGINEKESIHYWDNIQGDILVSVESRKELRVFKDIDSAVNWLFLSGFKESARQLNKAKGV